MKDSRNIAIAVLLGALVILSVKHCGTIRHEQDLTAANDSLQAATARYHDTISRQNESIIKIIQLSVKDTAAVRSLTTDSIANSIRSIARYGMLHP